MAAQRPPSYDVGVFNGQYREWKATYIRYAFPGGMMRVNDNGAFFLLQKFKFCCNYGPPCLGTCTLPVKWVRGDEADQSILFSRRTEQQNQLPRNICWTSCLSSGICRCRVRVAPSQTRSSITKSEGTLRKAEGERKPTLSAQCQQNRSQNIILRPSIMR